MLLDQRLVAVGNVSFPGNTVEWEPENIGMQNAPPIIETAVLSKNIADAIQTAVQKGQENDTGANDVERAPVEG